MGESSLHCCIILMRVLWKYNYYCKIEMEARNFLMRGNFYLAEIPGQKLVQEKRVTAGERKMKLLK